MSTSLAPTEVIKVESEDEETDTEQSEPNLTRVEDSVPFHDLNKSQTLRIFPLNMQEQSQATSFIFPSTIQYK